MAARPDTEIEPAFRQAEEAFERLRGQYAAGSLSADAFKTAVEAQRVDHDGRWWMLGVNTGRWYVHDGTAWTEAEPPRAAAPTPAAPPPAPPPTPAVVPTRRTNPLSLVAAAVGVATTLVTLAYGVRLAISAWADVTRSRTAAASVEPPAAPGAASSDAPSSSNGGSASDLAPPPTDGPTAPASAATTPSPSPPTTEGANSGSRFDSYPTGLNPMGDNWLALRSAPGGEGVRLDKLGPDARFAVLERDGDWLRVQLPDGRTGWVASRYVGCCERGE